MKKEDSDIWIVYDGECPLCKRYVRYLRLKEVFNVHLINAREGGSLVEEIQNKNLDLDEGMVLKMNGELYHGPECVHRLAFMTTPSTFFNKLNALIFRSRFLSRMLYPLLRAGRNISITLLGKGKINPPT